MADVRAHRPWPAVPASHRPKPQLGPDRLTDREVARLVKRTAMAAGVRADLAEGAHQEAFAGHSLRAGLASSAQIDEGFVQCLAIELGIDIVVHHLPPGTSKWNKIEHRLFSFISLNWKAQPLVSYRVIVDLIGATTTQTGLTVRCELDSNVYTKGIVVSDQEMAALNLSRDAFHGEWNYTLHPSISAIISG